MVKDSIKLSAIIVLTLLLLVSAGFNFYQITKFSKFEKESNIEKDQMQSKITSLDTTINNLQTSNVELDAKLNSSLIQISQKDANFVDYKKTLKEYFSMNKVILDDATVISETATSFYNEQSTDYNSNKVIVDRYITQVNLMRTHISQYKTLLTNKKELFQELGVDVEVEKNKIDQALPLYDDAFLAMNRILETLK